MASVSGGVYPVDNINNLTLEPPLHSYSSASRQSASDIFHNQGTSKSSRLYTLKEAYWSDRHRKMGISLATKEKHVMDFDYQKMLEEQIQFIRYNFRQKECSYFIPVPGQCGKGNSCKVKELRCHCGEIFSMHAGARNRSYGLKIPEELASVLQDPEAVLNEDPPVPADKWNFEDHITERETNAFGKIVFNVEQIGGRKPAKYVRLSSDDSIDKCLELMQNYWHIMEPEPPNLVISVVGGAKNFKLSGRSRSIFSTGLIKAAKTTKAWLITSGFNMGVMKSVGQAVHEGQMFQWNNDRMSHVIRCIGIAPWGYVKDRHCLESSGSGNFNVHYRSSTQIEHKQPVPLNPDHTHFIFVDDGYRCRYGGVADFRSAFEKRIAQDRIDGGLGIPVVLLLVEGGTDAIQDVSASLSQGIPVVVCAGTGRAADILEYAYNHILPATSKQRMSKSNREKLKVKIAQAYKKDGEELENLTAEVIKSCQQKNLMYIFNMKKHGELDMAILSVLLQAETDSSRESQLRLAMTWNRADIAQEEIFREDAIWSKESLEEFLTVALVEGKAEFVKLLLSNGIIMQEYLTTGRLETLYNSIPEHSCLHQVLKASNSVSEAFTIKDIEHFLQKMLDKFDIDEMVDDTKEQKLFKSPYKQLLIWAVLTNRNEFAHLFLELGEEPIVSALICTALCHGMEGKVPKYMTVDRNKFIAMKEEFEKLAISVLDECHSNDPDKAIMLVEKKSPIWSNLTCLQVAASAYDQEFVSAVACQNSVDNVWKSGIMSNWREVVLCALCPPLILIFVEMSLMGKKVMSKMQKMFSFYTAPITKFCLYTASYVGFLLLFTYMLLVDYGETPSVTEWILMIWIISFLLGKIHTFFVFPSPTFKGKLRDHFGFLERMDFLNLMLFLIAFCVRWFYVFDGKIIYCVNAVIFYISIIRLYAANRKLGPKIYMIKVMFFELIIFVMVLTVFLLAYGVASQGILYKHRTRTWSILKDILYFPYWQLYGELFLEELETDETCMQSLQYPNNEAECRTFHWMVPILLALYLLIGNVLLLNLLIAIFSHVFETVETNAIVIWKYQMYFLVMEFQNKPLLVPPLSLFVYLWLLVKWIYRIICCQHKPKAEQFTKYHLEYLSLFEKEMLANKLRPSKTDVIYSLDQKFHALQTRMDELTKLIEDEVLASLPQESNQNRQEPNHNENVPVKQKRESKRAIRNQNKDKPAEKPALNEDKLLNIRVLGKDMFPANVATNSDGEHHPSENNETVSHHHEDAQLPLQPPSSPDKQPIFTISSNQGGSTLQENISRVSAKLLNSRFLKFKLPSTLSLDSSEDLTPVELNAPSAESTQNLSKSSRRQTARPFDRTLSATSTDSNDSFRKRKSKHHKKKHDDLQSDNERTSYSSHKMHIFQ